MFAFKINWFDGGHADIFQTFEVVEIALAESHEETDAFDAFQIEGEGFEFLVVQQIHVFAADFGKIVFALNCHRFSFDPVAVFPVAAFGGNADVDFGVEIGSEGIAVIAAVAIQNV